MCKSCGKRLEEGPAGRGVQGPGQASRFSNVQPPSHLILLSLATDRCRERGLPAGPPGPPVAGFVLLTVIQRAVGRNAEVSLLAVLAEGLLLLASAVLSAVQKDLNQYWRATQPDLPIRRRFTGLETVLLVLGGIFWLLAILGSMMPA